MESLSEEISSCQSESEKSLEPAALSDAIAKRRNEKEKLHKQMKNNPHRKLNFGEYCNLNEIKDDNAAIKANGTFD